MDQRDFELWYRRAKKSAIVREAMAINAGRYAQAALVDYQDKMSALEWGEKLIDAEEEQTHE